MTIRFTCSECGSMMKIKDDLAGTAAKCPKCKTPFTVPEPDADAPSSHEIQIPPLVSSDQSDQESKPAKSSNGQTAAHETSAHSKESSSPKSDHSESSGGFHLQLDDSDDELPVVNVKHAPANRAPASSEDSEGKLPVVKPAVEIRATVSVAAPAVDDVIPLDEIDEDDDEENLDCPPMLNLLFLRELQAEPEEEEPKKKAPVSRVPPEFAAEAPTRSPRTPAAPRKEAPVDPMRFLGNDDFDEIEPPERERGRPAKSSAPLLPPIENDEDEEEDLSLSDDSGFDISATPTPQPTNRRTPAAPAARQPSEKPDLATAAKMMKKAIKDSQAETTRQREIDAQPKYDYFLFFREFGLRGSAILAAAVLGPLMLYFISDYLISSTLKTPKLGYVTGNVKLDGKPLPNVIVFMAPVEITSVDGGKKERARTSVGTTDEAGHFRMNYFQKVQGVAVGKCRVWLSGNGVTRDWMETSQRTIEVTPGHQKNPLEIYMESKNK